MAIENSSIWKAEVPARALQAFKPEDCMAVASNVTGFQDDAMETAVDRAEAILLSLSMQFEGTGTSRLKDEWNEHLIGAARGELGLIRRMIEHARFYAAPAEANNAEASRDIVRSKALESELRIMNEEIDKIGDAIRLVETQDIEHNVVTKHVYSLIREQAQKVHDRVVALHENPAFTSRRREFYDGYAELPVDTISLKAMQIKELAKAMTLVPDGNYELASIEGIIFDICQGMSEALDGFVDADEVSQEQ